MTKKEALSVFERAGYTYVGLKDSGWGCKEYTFTHPEHQHELTYTLSLLRSKARHLDNKMWLDAQREELRQGIQQELFSDTEIELHYSIVNWFGQQTAKERVGL